MAGAGAGWAAARFAISDTVAILVLPAGHATRGCARAPFYGLAGLSVASAKGNTSATFSSFQVQAAS